MTGNLLCEKDASIVTTAKWLTNSENIVRSQCMALGRPIRGNVVTRFECSVEQWWEMFFKYL